jgi:hypothetical protein
LKRDFGDFESYEELHDFGNDTNFTGMVLDTLEKASIKSQKSRRPSTLLIFKKKSRNVMDRTDAGAL